MIEFAFKSERDKFVKRIKSEGLFSTINDEIEDNTIKDLLSIVFDNAFARLNEDDYDQLVENVCEDISYDTNDIWEVYFDREEEGDYTNDNYSIFIVSNHEPTIEEALRVAKEHDALHEGYHIRFIQESDWDEEDIELEDMWDL